MNKKTNKKNRGFSLVELIIVIAIMAILAGVLAPQFVKYLDSSKKSADIQTAQSIATAVSAQYAQDAVDSTNIIKKTTLTEIKSSDSTLIAVIGDTPKSKLDTAAVFYYYVDANGKVEIYAGATSATSTSDTTISKIYPDIAAGSKWK